MSQLRQSTVQSSQKEKLKPFEVEPFALEFKLGIDRDKLNQLVDELEGEDFIEKQRRLLDC